MQLGVSSYAFGWAVGVPGHPPPVPFTELDLVAFARRHRLGLIQLGDHLPLHRFDEARLDRLRAAAGRADAPIRIETGGRGLTEAHLARYIGLSKELGARLLRFVIDGPGYEPERNEIVMLLRSAVPELAAAGITLGIENHDRFPARTLRGIIEQIDSPHVGICLDTANSLGAAEGLGEVLEQLAHLTVNLHLKDFTIRRVPHAMGFVVEGCPAGRGRLDVAALRTRLARCGRCRSAVLETWPPLEATIVATLVTEQRWAEESLAYLKPLFPTS